MVSRKETGMAKGTKKKDHTYDETIAKAKNTGFLFDISINFYENHTHDELIEKGYNEVQVDCANKVLAKFHTSVGAKLGLCKPELWCVHPCADCGRSVDDRKFNTFPIHMLILHPRRGGHHPVRSAASTVSESDSGIHPASRIALKPACSLCILKLNAQPYT
jgi:hypothetical protein